MTNDNTAEQLRASSLETVVAFLLGEAELDGVWFGDKNTRRKGAFWWREYLREAFEFGPIAWESTTPVYFKYVTQAKYEKFSPAVRQWYKPYRCTDCANTRADSGEAVAWRYRHAVEPSGWTTFISKARAEFLRVEGYIVEPLFTHPSATALDVRDAERYRWLRDNPIRIDAEDWVWEQGDSEVIALDERIDAALSQRVEKGKATEVGL